MAMATVTADPSYEKIKKFVIDFETMAYHTNAYYKIISDVNFNEIDEETIRLNNVYINTYIYSIYYYLYQYIYFLNNKHPIYYDRLKEYEPKFIELFYEIMTNNYKNIKYQITHMIISSSLDVKLLVNYLNITKYNNIELIYLLERINPSELVYFTDLKIAEFIFNKLSSYLRLMWMGAIVKGTVVFALMTNFIKYMPIDFFK